MQFLLALLLSFVLHRFDASLPASRMPVHVFIVWLRERTKPASFAKLILLFTWFPLDRNFWVHPSGTSAHRTWYLDTFKGFFIPAPEPSVSAAIVAGLGEAFQMLLLGLHCGAVKLQYLFCLTHRLFLRDYFQIIMFPHKKMQCYFIFPPFCIIYSTWGFLKHVESILLTAVFTFMHYLVFSFWVNDIANDLVC